MLQCADGPMQSYECSPVAFRVASDVTRNCRVAGQSIRAFSRKDSEKTFKDSPSLYAVVLLLGLHGQS